MVLRKRWEIREYAGDSPLGRVRVEEWEGWYLLGLIPLWRRLRTVRFER